MNWICAKLASCFNAHLSDRELKVKEAADELREAINNFEAKRKKLASLTRYDRVWLNYSEYGVRKSNSLGYFSLSDIEVNLTETKKI